MSATLAEVIIYIGSAATIVFLVVVCIGFGRFMARMARGWRPEEPSGEEPGQVETKAKGS